MFVKKVLYKLYLKLIFFSLVFFLSTSNLVISAVLTEEEIKAVKENAIRYQENWKKYSKSIIS